MQGVSITPLKQIKDERGSIMHMLRSSDPLFQSFGEIYFSWINPGIIKGWHKHTKTTVNFAVPVGAVKIVIFEEMRNQSQEICLSPDHYQLLTIQPGLWYSFACLSSTPAMIANCASHPHDPAESQKTDLDTLPYHWEIKSE